MFASTEINVEKLNLLSEVHNLGNHFALNNWRILEVTLFREFWKWHFLATKSAWSRVSGVLLLRKCGGKKVIDTKKTNLLPGSD